MDTIYYCLMFIIIINLIVVYCFRNAKYLFGLHLLMGIIYSTYFMNETLDYNFGLFAITFIVLLNISAILRNWKGGYD